MSHKLVKENNKDNSKKKIGKDIIILAIIVIVIILINIISTILYISMKDNGKILSTEEIFNNLNNEYEKEAYKYTKILENDKIEDIYNYMLSSIKENEYYPTEVMDYTFKTLFPKATYNEKINLFFLYYQNTVVTEEIFYDYLNINGVKNYFDTYWNGYDFNTLEGISNCRQKDIQYLLLTIKANDYYVKENFPEILIRYDWDLFIEKFGDILDEDYIKFAKLLAESNEMIVNPNMNKYNPLISLWFVHNYEDYIKNASNEYLKAGAQSIYEQHLDLFLGQYNSSFILNDDGTSLISDVLIAYQTYIELYPNDYTSKLLEEVFDLVYNDTTGNLISNIGNLENSFVDEAEWLVDDSSINEFFINQTTSNESTLY